MAKKKHAKEVPFAAPEIKTLNDIVNKLNSLEPDAAFRVSRYIAAMYEEPVDATMNFQWMKTDA